MKKEERELKKEAVDFFWKLRTFLDICYRKREKGLNFDEVCSLWLSNFTGKEIIKFHL